MNLFPAKYGLFGCPAVVSEIVDIGVLGLPCDTGMLGDKLPSRAPSVLREVSRAFCSTFDKTGSGIGWWDYDTQRVLLEGIRWGDFGDAETTRRLGSSNLEGVTDLVKQLLHQCKVLLVFGGDHSISYYLNRGTRMPLLVIDAHEDATRISGEHPHHGNWITATENANVDLPIAQLGLRGIVPNKRLPPGRNRTILTGPEAISNWIDINAIRELHVSIDVDILDPTVLRSVASPSPNGWSCNQLQDTITAIAKQTRVRVIDIVEFCPTGENGWYESALLAFSCLRMLDSVLLKCPRKL